MGTQSKDVPLCKITLNSRMEWNSVIDRITKFTSLEFLITVNTVSLKGRGESFLSAWYFPRICEVVFLVIISENQHNLKVPTSQCLQ